MFPLLYINLCFSPPLFTPLSPLLSPSLSTHLFSSFQTSFLLSPLCSYLLSFPLLSSPDLTWWQSTLSTFIVFSSTMPCRALPTSLPWVPRNPLSQPSLPLPPPLHFPGGRWEQSERGIYCGGARIVPTRSKGQLQGAIELNRTHCYILSCAVLRNRSSDWIAFYCSTTPCTVEYSRAQHCLLQHDLCCNCYRWT